MNCGVGEDSFESLGYREEPSLGFQVMGAGAGLKKAECRRTDAFELWCWRRLLRVPWTARRSNRSILKEISPECGRTNAEAETPIFWPLEVNNLPADAGDVRDLGLDIRDLGLIPGSRKIP